MGGIFTRRMTSEWQLLGELAASNRDRLTVHRRYANEDGEAVQVSLGHTSGLVRLEQKLINIESHALTMHYRRFFPSVPIEISLHRPIFHPNVHPQTGFVCLWQDWSAATTTVHALAQLQRVITWTLFNRRSEHVMQPEALSWLDHEAAGVDIPLAHVPLTPPDGFVGGHPSAADHSTPQRRRRLTLLPRPAIDKTTQCD